jgi:hypothetical protein
MNVRTLPLLLWAVISLGACSGGDKDEVEPGTGPVDTTMVKTGVYTLADVAADTIANSGSQAKPLYYSLEDNKVVPENQLQTANWDIVFNGTYNSNIACNNGKALYSPGYGGPGKGGIYLVKDEDIDAQYYDAPNKPIRSVPARSLFDEAFAKVKVAPADDQFQTNKVIGLDYFSGSEDGWAYYDFYGQLFPGKPADTVAHVSYTLPRTVIVRTAKGNYAKLVVYSVYKGAPVIPTRSYKPGYISFKYAIQKDGTKILDVK